MTLNNLILKGSVPSRFNCFYRQITMYILEKELGLTLIQVAELLNRKDHTTALHAKQKISNLILRDPNLKKEVDIITQSLFQST